jgi:Flp pilus assembly pilin Flp
MNFLEFIKNIVTLVIVCGLSLLAGGVIATVWDRISEYMKGNK